MGVEPVLPAHVGNILWFVIDDWRGALGYDLTTKTITQVELPEENRVFHGVLTAIEKCGLGLD